MNSKYPPEQFCGPHGMFRPYNRPYGSMKRVNLVLFALLSVLMTLGLMVPQSAEARLLFQEQEERAERRQDPETRQNRQRPETGRPDRAERRQDSTQRGRSDERRQDAAQRGSASQTPNPKPHSH